MILKFMCGVATAATVAFAGQAMAQTSENIVAANTDWTVFVEDNPKECWSVSAPKQTINTRDGKTVSVQRGDIRLFVFYRPGEKVKGQIAFTGGYPFASNSTADMNIGGTKFQLFTEGEWAWPATADDDAKIVAAMKRGADAVLTARSGRGTLTQDTFSLLGFTATVEEAAKRCDG